LLDPLFNMATPGFAFVFGITLGYYYFPRFATNRARVQYMLRFGLYLLSAAIVIEAGLGMSVRLVQGERITSHEFWISLFGPLLYYFVALATAPVWFRVIGWFRWELLACFGLILLSYGIHRALVFALLDREQTGLFQLIRLMLVAKYAYFNMSIGALSGLALGIYLYRRPDNRWLAARMLVVALLIGGAGLVYLRMERGDLAALADGEDMGPWRWAVYSAVVLLMAAGLRLVLDHFEKVPALLRNVLNLTGIVGQCSLLIYVLHGGVLRVKVLLAAAGLPDSVALGIPLLLFLAACLYVMNRIYRLYYGSILGSAN
jgi:hypothetical protein